MTSRKPKLNLLYVEDAASWLQPRLQLAVATPESISVQQRQHAAQWQATRDLPARGKVTRH